MVNTDSPEAPTERRQQPRADAEHAPVFAGSSLNPFGDLHTLQHLSARLARGMRRVFEPMLGRAVRSWAEPVSVQRFADYCAEREQGLTAWLPLAMSPGGGQALLVLDGRFVLELLDRFFGGNGDGPSTMPAEFSAAAESMVHRLARMMDGPITSAWEPVARIGFEATSLETNPVMLSTIDSDDPMVITRFGIAADGAKPEFVDLLYPVSALKPFGAELTAKVHGRSAEPDPRWNNGLTRAAMKVRFKVRSVLAEPTITIGQLMELREGDVIPIRVDRDVPVMVANNRIGAGTVGTANGRAAIRINSLDHFDEEDFQ
ncbi:flagellar motor switch protein FliM [Stakelama saccharophila]|uniref:Flagellar motor switch protein FliM n=1 Tax=Stakelama saccharophila TaxID=3075605 RepID=A0ABZ0B8U1_9SPHN|nr:flagellar motor switch protein FliM [Stakelama sp. W311]WNO53700.1 flagellar motor switch protein FliM [Stakelama sp. W311]